MSHSGIDRRTILRAIAAIPAITPGVRLLGADGPAGSRPRRARGSLSLAHRVPEAHWQADERFALLLKFLTTHRAAVEEVVLGEGSDFWTPLDQIERSNEVLARRIARLKEAGWPTGINFGLTMGHEDAPAGSVPPLPMPSTVGHDGRISNACPCPNSSEYRANISARYALMARTNPDFIWTDDDLRASHHGPVYPCFCPICLKLFGHGEDREELVNQLNAPGNGDLRKAWTEFRAASTESVCADIRRAIT
jgi:hypothetical protein